MFLFWYSIRNRGDRNKSSKKIDKFLINCYYSLCVGYFDRLEFLDI